MDDTDKERFHLSYVFIDDCWIWFRGLVKDGYGGICIKGKYRRAHRVSYELAYGVTLSPDQFLHHTCKNKACVNPLHLEITTQFTHVDSATFGNKEKTHCPYSHEYTPENTRWNKGGKSRECYTCKKQRIRRRYYRLQQGVADRLEMLAAKHRLP